LHAWVQALGMQAKTSLSEETWRDCGDGERGVCDCPAESRTGSTLNLGLDSEASAVALKQK
jgi:hypothetical protein